MEYKASKVDKTFDRVVAQLNDYTKVFRQGGMLEKAIDEIDGDPAWLNDVREKLDDLIDIVNDAHMYAMMGQADINGESVNNEGNLRNPAARAVTEPTGDDDKYPPVVMPKIKKPTTTEAVGEFAQPYFDLIDRAGGDDEATKLVNREALAWLGGNARDEITGGDDNYEDYMSHNDLVNEITRYMNSDEIKEFVAHFEQHYDLNAEEEMEEAIRGKKNNDAEIWADAVDALHGMGGDLEDSETYDWYAVAQAIAKKHGGWDEDKYEPTDEFVDKIMNLANKHVSANESLTYLKKLAGL